MITTLPFTAAILGMQLLCMITARVHSIMRTPYLQYQLFVDRLPLPLLIIWHTCRKQRELLPNNNIHLFGKLLWMLKGKYFPFVTEYTSPMSQTRQRRRMWPDQSYFPLRQILVSQSICASDTGGLCLALTKRNCHYKVGKGGFLDNHRRKL